MNGYPKMKFLRSRTTNSRSMDFVDLLSFPPQNPTSKPPSFPDKPTTSHDLVSDDEDGRKGGKSFGGVLRRNSSVTSASSSIHSSLKRAFSMRRSSSVSERYCRIHDQSATAFLQSPPNNCYGYDEDEEEAMDGGGGTMQGTSMDKNNMMMKKKKKLKNGKIFKACKRLFGL